MSSSHAGQYLLPSEAYTSREWFEREQQELFGRCWYFAGMTEDAPQAGDYFCIEASSHPLVVIRGQDLHLAAFHNLCRHRGAMLLEGKGHLQNRIRCFYHNWTYGVDGTLKGVPQKEAFPGIDFSCLGLHPASVSTFKGMVFVHPDPRPPESLEEWLSDLPQRMGPYEPERLLELVRQRREIGANWKLFIENHIDGYHLWHLHFNSLTEYDHNKQAARQCGRHWSLYEPQKAASRRPADQAQTGLPVIDHIDPRWYGSSVHLVFPNLAMAAGGTFWLTLQAIPLAPDRTALDLRIRGMPISQARLATLQAIRHLSNKWKRFTTPSFRSWEDLLQEDIRACESIQRAARSSRFGVGPLARPYENSITEFHKNLLAFVNNSDFASRYK